MTPINSTFGLHEGLLTKQALFSFFFLSKRIYLDMLITTVGMISMQEIIDVLPTAFAGPLSRVSMQVTNKCLTITNETVLAMYEQKAGLVT